MCPVTLVAFGFVLAIAPLMHFEPLLLPRGVLDPLLLSTPLLPSGVAPVAALSCRVAPFRLSLVAHLR